MRLIHYWNHHPKLKIKYVMESRLSYICLVNYFKYSYFLLIGAKKQCNINIDGVENEFICLYLVSLFLFDMLIHNYFLCCSMRSISSSNISSKKQSKRKLKSLGEYNINDSNCISSRYQLHINDTFHTRQSWESKFIFIFGFLTNFLNFAVLLRVRGGTAYSVWHKSRPFGHETSHDPWHFFLAFCGPITTEGHI